MGMPVFEEGRILFSACAYKSLLNFMATHPAMESFKDQLAKFKTGKTRYNFPMTSHCQRRLFERLLRFVRSKLRKTTRIGCIERIDEADGESLNRSLANMYRRGGRIVRTSGPKQTFHVMRGKARTIVALGSKLK